MAPENILSVSNTVLKIDLSNMTSSGEDQAVMHVGSMKHDLQFLTVRAAVCPEKTDCIRVDLLRAEKKRMKQMKILGKKVDSDFIVQEIRMKKVKKCKEELLLLMADIFDCWPNAKVYVFIFIFMEVTNKAKDPKATAVQFFSNHSGKLTDTVGSCVDSSTNTKWRDKYKECNCQTDNCRAERHKLIELQAILDETEHTLKENELQIRHNERLIQRHTESVELLRRALCRLLILIALNYICNPKKNYLLHFH